MRGSDLRKSQKLLNLCILGPLDGRYFYLKIEVSINPVHNNNREKTSLLKLEILSLSTEDFTLIKTDYN